jgi:hypothetical protein
VHERSAETAAERAIAQRQLAGQATVDRQLAGDRQGP